MRKNTLALLAAGLLTFSAVGMASSAERGRDSDAGVGIHVGPLHMGAGVGETRHEKRHDEYRRGQRFHVLPSGIRSDDRCWVRKFATEEWTYVCN